MKVKKYRHADLERKRSVFFQIGLIVALAASLAAFEWTSEDVTVPIIYEGADPYEVDLILPEPIKLEEKKPEPMKKQEILAPIIELTDNNDPNAGEVNFISENIVDVPFEIPELPSEPEDNSVHIIVERMPEPAGGMEGLMKYFAESIRYPVICAEMGIQGRVYVAFVVDKDGSITDVKIMRSPDANLSKEAVRVVSSMPKWTPGRQGGKPVRVSYTVPVNFKLQK
ncbi:TonB family protein [Carboxylicivirga caseinilyticus]|uniref:energy transducer TonB n=1 Tax=Carboxylicivirga caseinilyticus TaxID=3417572 RepID=UPI003D352570|nr:energy transducer TonB [Marinilabiliaceae bacterium A049]